jgi:hypothetical protein
LFLFNGDLAGSVRPEVALACGCETLPSGAFWCVLVRAAAQRMLLGYCFARYARPESLRPAHRESRESPACAATSGSRKGTAAMTPGTSPQPGAGPHTATFVGFGTLEGWAEAIDPARPVLAMPLVETGPTSGGINTEELLVACAQVSPTDGTVLYCRLRAASLTRCHGEPFDSDWKERDAAWKSLWQIVRA